MNDTSTGPGTAAEEGHAPTRIGAVGLGIVGLPCARNLRQAGCNVVGLHIASTPLAAFAEIGGQMSPGGATS
jgi:UDP-N-acetyl-D-mannosaminuronate dehydrogenase